MIKKLHLLIYLSFFTLAGYAQLPSYVPVNGLVAFYPFNGNANDASANTLHGSLNGTTLPSPTVDRYLNANSAYSFSDSYVYVASNPLFNTGNGLSVSAWVNFDFANLNQKIAGRTNASFNSGFVFAVQNNQVYPEVWDNAGTHFTFNAGAVSTGAWDHLVMTWNSGGYMVVYVNGIAADSIAASANPIGSNSEPFIIGVSPWSLSPSALAVFGDLDDIGVWNRALTATEVLALYQGIPQGLQAVTPGDRHAVFPNPAREQFTVDLPNQNFSLEICDVSGRVVYYREHVYGKTNINCLDFPNGAYSIKAVNNAHCYAWKTMIMR